jgi:NAD(P)-dependent dehydrogenase (short-subunit alcohol dehydrogenase family)
MGLDPAVLPQRISFTKTYHTKPYPFISPNRPELSAAGRNIVITGGGTGIGNAIAVGFAQAGAKSVAIIGRRIEKLKSDAAAISAAASDKSTHVLYEQADLLDRDQTTRAFQSIAEKVGKIDVFVSNAGGAPEGGVLTSLGTAELVRSFEGNVLTAFNAIQAFLPLAGPDPVLISTNTCMAHFQPIPGFGPYSISRAAALKMTGFFAAENPHVHVVDVQPGWVPTDMNGHQDEAPDSGKALALGRRMLFSLHSLTINTSGTPWPVLRMACIPSGQVFARQVRVG